MFLRGEDLLSSTPRQVVLYRALMDIGRAQAVPEFGHLPYVMGRAIGSCPSETRSPTSSSTATAGMIPAGPPPTTWPSWDGH